MSQTFKNLFSSNTVEWGTPQALFDYLDKEFKFQLDVCASPTNAKCSRYFTQIQDGLQQDWVNEDGSPCTFWMNPPYGEYVNRELLALNQPQYGLSLVTLPPYVYHKNTSLLKILKAKTEDKLLKVIDKLQTDATPQELLDYGPIEITDDIIKVLVDNIGNGLPYIKTIEDWMAKAVSDVEKHNSIGVCLLPSKTDTNWFHEYAMKGYLDFIQGRLAHVDQEGNECKGSTFGSVITVLTPDSIKQDLTSFTQGWRACSLNSTTTEKLELT